MQNEGPFDLYRLETGLGSVAENAKKLLKCFINFCRIVADLSQNSEFLFSQFGVDLVQLMSAVVDRQLDCRFSCLSLHDYTKIGGGGAIHFRTKKPFSLSNTEKF